MYFFVIFSVYPNSTVLSLKIVIYYLTASKYSSLWSHTQVKYDNINERFLIFVTAQQSSRVTEADKPINCTTSQVKPSNLLPKMNSFVFSAILKFTECNRMRQWKLMQISIASNGIGKSCDATTIITLAPSHSKFVKSCVVHNPVWSALHHSPKKRQQNRNRFAGLTASSRWWLADADVNLSGTRIGEIGDHVIGISLTAETVGRWCGQGLGQPQKVATLSEAK